MKNFHPTRNQFRQMFRPKTIHPDTIIVRNIELESIGLRTEAGGS